MKKEIEVLITVAYYQALRRKVHIEKERVKLQWKFTILTDYVIQASKRQIYALSLDYKDRCAW